MALHVGEAICRASNTLMWDMLQKLELNVDDRGIYYKYLVHEVYIPPKQKINVKNNLLV